MPDDIEKLRFQARILERLKYSIISTDLDGYITGFNKGAEKMFGYAGKMELNLDEFRICELVERCLMMFKEKAMKHRIKLDVEGNKGLTPVIADEPMIKLVLYNLLSNAMKFTPDGGCITVGVQQISNGDDYIEVSVTDTGIGISAEKQKNLFQPFQQGEHPLTKTYEGTGLGLVLCKRFVEMHNGRIWVESEVDQGSTFVFLMPVRQNRIQGERT